MTSIVLVGSNPGVLLRDAVGVTALASVWVVDYSERGAGTALVLWHGGRVRTIGLNVALAEWLADDFVRHFPEADGLPWMTSEPQCLAVEVEIDLSTGLRASAGDVELIVSDVLDRRVFSSDAFVLGSESYRMSNVYVPCAAARLSVAGVDIPGEPVVELDGPRPASTAFLAVAEVWSLPSTDHATDASQVGA